MIKPLVNRIQRVSSPAVSPLAKARNDTWMLFRMMNAEVYGRSSTGMSIHNSLSSTIPIRLCISGGSSRAAVAGLTYVAIPEAMAGRMKSMAAMKVKIQVSRKRRGKPMVANCQQAFHRQRLTAIHHRVGAGHKLVQIDRDLAAREIPFRQRQVGRGRPVQARHVTHLGFGESVHVPLALIEQLA